MRSLNDKSRIFMKSPRIFFMIILTLIGLNSCSTVHLTEENNAVQNTPLISPAGVGTQVSTIAVSSSTPTLAVVTLPVKDGDAVPTSFGNVVISPENATSLEEVVRIDKGKLILFDVKHWDNLWLAETNQGVKLFSEDWELLADLGKSQRRCSIPKNVIYIQPSNIYIGPGGIGVVALDGVHIFSLDGKTEKKFIPLDKKYAVVMSSLTLCESSVFYASVSPDMNWVSVVKLTGSYSTIEIFSGSTGKDVAAVGGEGVKMFSPNGQYLLTDNGDNRYVLYRTDDWSSVMLIRLDEFTYNYGFSPSSEYLYYFRESRAAVVFRLPNGNKTLVIKDAKSLWFNDAEEEVGALLSTDTKNIHVFDFETGKETRVEKFLIARWRPGILELEDFSAPTHKFDDRENYEVECNFENADSYSCRISGYNCEFDLEGANACSASGKGPGLNFSNAGRGVISKDGSFGLFSANNGGVSLYDQKENEEILSEFVDSGKGSIGVAFSDDSRLAAFVVVKPDYIDGATLLAGNLVLYDVVEKKDVLKIKLNLYQGNVSMLAFSPDTDLIAVGTFDGKVTIYEVSTGMEVHEFFAHVGMINDLEFSPDGKWLLTAGGMDEVVKLWAVQSQ